MAYRVQGDSKDNSVPRHDDDFPLSIKGSGNIVPVVIPTVERDGILHALLQHARGQGDGAKEKAVQAAMQFFLES